jgi:ATP-dependent Clp protease ATP-binding subunit ClpC
VGKTAIVEGIAQRIISGDVPDFLKNKEIIELSTGMLVAGTTYRGQFETKIKRIIDEVTKQGNVILFIDEIHTIMGAGRVEGGNLDFSQMFKPALARGEITCIGATTLQEYRKYIEKDQALERRFYPIKVEEPGLDDTREILAASREKAESYYKITISDEIINSIVQLTDQHLKKRFFPDKAIDVFEKAAARAALRGGKIVSPETIKEIIGEISGINFMENDPSSTHRLLELHAKLKMDIFGQDEAIDKVCNILKITKRRLDLRPEKPDGVFLFSGPSGVGKTWLAKRLTHHLFGDEKRLIRADMSEFSDQTSVNRIIGAPPGYVGYDDETPLTSKIENYPSSILLLDEIEKAHPDVIRLFLQIFDEGRITDSHGRKIYFSNTTIIMTSNVLTHRASPLGFATSTETEPLGEAERKAMDQHFPREFLNRIDEVILFSSLERSHIVKILREKVLQQSKQRFTRENVNLTFSDTLIDHVVNLGYDPEWGARNLERTFERIVLGPLVNQILTNPQGNSLLHLDWQNNNLVITTEQLTDIPDHQ